MEKRTLREEKVLRYYTEHTLEETSKEFNLTIEDVEKIVKITNK